VHAGSQPLLAQHDLLNIFGRQGQQTLLIAAALLEIHPSNSGILLVLIEVFPYARNRRHHKIRDSRC
jgi:hypothetical protein